MAGLKAGKRTAPNSGKYPKRKLNVAVHLLDHPTCPDVAQDTTQIISPNEADVTCFFCKPYKRLI